MEQKTVVLPDPLIACFADKTKSGIKPFFRVAYGGRASGKSWGFAQMAILRAMESKSLILCTRELQRSIKQSVHRLIVSQVERLGVSHLFDIGESFIRGKNGSEFIFAGLRYNTDEIKSTEGVDICWVEEAHLTSKDSWDLLEPTIRKPGSEIWVSFNPNLEKDATYQKFVANPPPNAIVNKVTWRHNPFLSDEIHALREHRKLTDPDGYNWIWEGNPRRISDAAILAHKVIMDDFAPLPSWQGPYFGADWGFSSDPMAITKSWIHDDCLWVEDERHAVGVEIVDIPSFIMGIPGIAGHTLKADAARPDIISHCSSPPRLSCKPAKKWNGSVEAGIDYLKSFKKIIIHSRCPKTYEEAMLYSYKVDKNTGEVLPIVLDKNNHCWDSVRYAHDGAIKPKNKVEAFII